MKELNPESDTTFSKQTETNDNMDFDLKNLTLEQKVSLISATDFSRMRSIPSLGIPYIKTSDGPNGVHGVDTGMDHFMGFPFHVSGAPPITSAAFPSSTALAATWDRSLARRAGSGIARDGKTKNVSFIMAPTINLIRDPRCGRSFETFSEDPLLTGHLALEWVRGAEDDQGVFVSLKHFVGNECETNRFTSNLIIEEDLLRNVYMRPFEIILRAKPDTGSIMLAYNSINGEPCSSNKFLMRDVVRRDWKYEGLLMSDWFGTYKNAESLIAGLDLEMPGPPLLRNMENLQKLLDSNEIQEEHINEAAGNVLRFINKTRQAAKKHNFQLFTEEERSKDVETAASEDETTRQDIVDIGTAASVLLKNEGQILPIEPEKQQIKHIVLIGQSAVNPAVHGGGSASLAPHRVVKPLDAIKDHLKQHHPQVKVDWLPGCEVKNCISDPTSENLGGKPIELNWHYLDAKDDAPFHQDSTTLPQLRNFMGGFSPQVDRPFEVRSEFDITTMTSGEHSISLQAFGSIKLQLSGPALAQNDKEQQSIEWNYEGEDLIPIMMFDSTKLLETRQYAMNANSKLHVSLCYRPPANPRMPVPGLVSTSFRVGFEEQRDQRKTIEEAALAASQADLAIVFTATGRAFESEGKDRKDILLPCGQDELVSAVAKKAGAAKTIVVNSTGSAVSMPWDGEVNGILQAWFSGQEIGYSIRNSLFALGKTQGPTGHLPMTWPRAIRDHGSFGNFPTSDNHPVNVQYKEGFMYGHRWYEDRKIEPLWWFGHGLSYTTFKVKLISSESDTVTVQVENVGKRVGKNTVQVYALSEGEKARKLVGFAVTNCLEPGQSEQITVDLDLSLCAKSEKHSLIVAESSNPSTELFRV